MSVKLSAIQSFKRLSVDTLNTLFCSDHDFSIIVVTLIYQSFSTENISWGSPCSPTLSNKSFYVPTKTRNDL